MAVESRRNRQLGPLFIGARAAPSASSRSLSISSCRLSAKAQIKIFETIAVLVIFFFFIAFGMKFYFTLQRADIQKELARAQEERTIRTAEKATFLPELDCNTIAVQQESCFDALKLDSVQGVFASAGGVDVYTPVFGYSTVNVTRLYPEPRSWLVYDRQRPGDVRRFQTPVLILDPVKAKYGYGIVEVSVYG